MIDDKQLIQDFLLNQDEAAFRMLYKSKTPEIYGMALRLNAHEKDLANELLQLTWIKAVEKLSTFKWNSTLKTWLIGIMINIHREQGRKRKEILPLQVIKNEASKVGSVINEMDLEKAISQLPEGYKEVILLHDVEGYKHREIAELLDISEGTSKSQLFYARQKMRKYLTEENKNTQAS